MSGLETAIRNALDRSDRSDAQTRARIYQSARQALEAGLRRQGVSDALIVMQQQKRLEDKIREIEKEELEKEETARLAQADPEPVLPADDFGVDPVSREPDKNVRANDPLLVEGERRTADVSIPPRPALSGRSQPSAPEIASVDIRREPGVAPNPDLAVEAPALDAGHDLAARRPTPELASAAPRSARRSSASKQDRLDGPPKRAAKPRKRRGFLSWLLTWVVTLLVVGGVCWWFYQSGMVQSVLQDAIQAADRAARDQAGRGSMPFDPRGGFSDDWVEIFKPGDVAKLSVSAQASAEAVSGSEGPAVRIASADAGQSGDVVIEVPADLLRQMAAKTSTIALTIQSGANQAAQLSVRCDFGSLGECARHRFTATQEKLEALFSVTFDRTLAPNSSGRLILNAGIDGGDKSVLLYSIRILPVQ